MARNLNRFIKKSILFFLFPVVLKITKASTIIVEGQKYASFLTVIAILVTLPAFISLYLHIRRTNLGHILFQPFLAMFVGFFGILLNSILDLYRIFNGFKVDNISMAMGLNRAISSVLIAAGCVIMFFNMRKKGLFDYSYYKKNKEINSADELNKATKKNITNYNKELNKTNKTNKNITNYNKEFNKTNKTKKNGNN